MKAHVEIPLTGGEIALVDVDDWPLVSCYHWCASRGRWGTYVVANTVANGRRTMVKLHRLILGAEPGQQVDHRNHNGLDNRRANLRVATPSQNAANNRPTTGRSGYKGVGWHKARGKWRAYITVDRQTRHLGLFEDPWEAAQAYADRLPERLEPSRCEVRQGQRPAGAAGHRDLRPVRGHAGVQQGPRASRPQGGHVGAQQLPPFPRARRAEGDPQGPGAQAPVLPAVPSLRRLPGGGGLLMCVGADSSAVV